AEVVVGVADPGAAPDLGGVEEEEALEGARGVSEPADAHVERAEHAVDLGVLRREGEGLLQRRLGGGEVLPSVGLPRAAHDLGHRRGGSAPGSRSRLRCGGRILREEEGDEEDRHSPFPPFGSSLRPEPSTARSRLPGWIPSIRSTLPEGQRTSTESARAASPRPKWTRGSFEDW